MIQGKVDSFRPPECGSSRSSLSGGGQICQPTGVHWQYLTQLRCPVVRLISRMSFSKQLSMDDRSQHLALRSASFKLACTTRLTYVSTNPCPPRLICVVTYRVLSRASTLHLPSLPRNHCGGVSSSPSGNRVYFCASSLRHLNIEDAKGVELDFDDVTVTGGTTTTIQVDTCSGDISSEFRSRTYETVGNNIF